MSTDDAISEIGFKNNRTVSTPKDDTQHVVIADTMHANIYFDGTGNNYYNTTASAQIKQQFGGDDSSYDNDLTNVARMWKALDTANDPTTPIIYIQGIGTTKEQADSDDGYALGTGKTGMEKRVAGAFAPLMAEVRKKRGKKGLPAILELNVFGFSRGAIAARVFVDWVNTQKHERFGKEWDGVYVRINFLGLFDSVSSEGIDHANDVKDLHLKLGPGHAQRVLHLVALDEYRKNFASTPVNSNDSSNIVQSIGMPGAHSDVGGSYFDNQKENRYLTTTNMFGRGTRDFVYQQGWYGPQDAAPNQATFPGLHTRIVQGDYYRVALTLMVDTANLYSGTHYPPALTASSNYPLIADVQKRLLALTQAGVTGNWRLEDLLIPSLAMVFRHAHLHLSCQEKSKVEAHAPRFKNDTELEREYVPI